MLKSGRHCTAVLLWHEQDACLSTKAGSLLKGAMSIKLSLLTSASLTTSAPLNEFSNIGLSPFFFETEQIMA
mgnify:FL=1